MNDYFGSMDAFEKQLKKAGVSKEEFDINNYVGLTFYELLALTEEAIARHKSRIMMEEYGA